MIKQEIVTINGRELKKTYSDLGFMIERNGKRYEEAIDTIEHGYVYMETEEPIPSQGVEPEKDALQLLYDNIDKGQQEQIVKRAEIQQLFDTFGVEYIK